MINFDTNYVNLEGRLGMMLADDVALVVTALAEAGVAAWLDGGWGVDALLGEQTREHDDLDLVMASPTRLRR